MSSDTAATAKAKGYVPTIGLEIHAELKTQTKMFCDSKNDPDEERANANTCPVCMAHPGTLPAINRAAVHHVLRVGAALDATLADYSEFDRKSYFYPDIPKGYQISQYVYPLVSGGELNGVQITRVHLEEDTASSTHASGASLVDFNRAGVPLMELVTEPVIHDAETAGAFARELQLLLRTLGASDANLEKGQMRVEANISVAKEGSEKFGTKTEVKNLNSFRSVERAIAYEIDRQITALEKGETLIQETRGWDEGKQQTFHQRYKEGSADYRYFPEPDLPKLKLSEVAEFSKSAVAATLPELPWTRRSRYAELGLNADAVEYLISASSRAAFYDAVLAELKGDAALAKLAANYLVSDLGGIYGKSGAAEYATLTPASFAALIRLAAESKLSSRGAKDVLAIMAVDGGEPEAIAKKKGLLQVHDPAALRAAVAEIISKYAAVADEYRAGKEAALQFLLGQAMKETKGAGNPATLKTLLIEELKGS